jgi:hypothetical protein
MNLIWIIRPEAPRLWLGEALDRIQQVFARVPHDFSQLPSGSVFFRCRGHREHGMTYVASRDSDHPHVFTVHLEHPDPVLLQLAQLIHERFRSCSSFEPEIHSREQEWAKEVLSDAFTPA